MLVAHGWLHHRMRITLSTIHGSDNYGAVLQASCLAHELAAFGTVEVLDHRPLILNAGYLQDCLPYQPLRRRPNPHLTSFIRKHRAMRRAQRTMLPLSDRVRRRPRAADYHAADVAVVGSDEVWSDLWGYQPQFFLADAPERTRRVAYAVSAGRSREWRAADAIRGELERFDTVLVRDANTAALTASAGRDPDEIVCDPVLLVDPAHLRALASTSARPAPAPGSYVLVYLEGCRADPVVARAVADLGVPDRLVSAGFWYPGAASRIAADPAEFVALVDNAALVITTMFHGIVTGLALDTPVAVIDHPAKAAKILDLLDRVQAVREQGLGYTLIPRADDVDGFRTRSRKALVAALS